MPRPAVGDDRGAAPPGAGAEPSARTFEVGASEAGERLDRLCATRLAGELVSRSVVTRWCDAGRVTLNDRAAKAASRVRVGDRVVVQIAPPEPSAALPEAIALDVVYEDAALLVVDKPAGLVVHPARGHARGTLVNAVLHHTGGALEDDARAPDRPGIVHRLDKDTSGLLVIAKTAVAREGLKAQFQAHSIERRYAALTLGVPEPAELTLDTLHGRHPTDRLRFTARVRTGKRATTHVARASVLAGGRAALVRCVLRTGRTHQIRMHLSEAGWPLLGDALYGRTPSNPLLRRVAAELGRQALHAELLGFVHPTTGARLRFCSELPADFATALDALRVE